VDPGVYYQGPLPSPNLTVQAFPCFFPQFLACASLKNMAISHRIFRICMMLNIVLLNVPIQFAIISSEYCDFCQKYIQFSIPLLEILQPILPYCTKLKSYGFLRFVIFGDSFFPLSCFLLSLILSFHI
jgi:hypothetical protein